VPFIVKGPDIAAGSRVEGNIYLLDVLATLCDLAGVTPPETNEGLSFKPVLTGEKKAVRDVLFGVYSGGSKPGMRAVKKGDWKLIRYEAPDRGVNETQLFNLAENPEELLPEHGHPNLALDPNHAEKLKEMEALLLAEMRQLNDPWRFSNQPSDDLPPPPAPAGKKKKAKK
jgi:arylsulfatase A-like enzyme